jgi:hypothetical protein
MAQQRDCVGHIYGAIVIRVGGVETRGGWTFGEEVREGEDGVGNVDSGIGVDIAACEGLPRWLKTEFMGSHIDTLPA